MIECPVCLNQNEEKSLFCAECGQRFVSANPAATPLGTLGSAGSAVAKFSDGTPAPGKPSPLTPTGISALNPDGSLLQPPNKQAAPKRPSIKLHSPILDSGGDRNFSGDDLEEDDFDQAANNNSAHHGLHSPLLDRESGKKGFAQHGKDSGSHFPHRNSVEFGTADHSTSQPRPERANRGLRSPLLGGAEAAGYDFEPDEDYLPELEEIDDPNVLRSPLLAAKLPLGATIDPASKQLQPGPAQAAANFPLPSNMPTGFQQTSSGSNRAVARTEDLGGHLERIGKRADSGISRDQRTPVSVSNTLRDQPDSIEQNALSKFAGYMLVPLILAVCLKTWFLVSMGGQVFSLLPFLSDQLGQLIVMIVLIAYILTITSSNSR